MRILSRVTLAIATIGVLAPAPALAQDSPSLPLTLPTVNVMSPAPSFKPATFAPRTTRGANEQGLGIFFQGGWINSQVRGGDEIFPTTAFDTSANGYMFGIAFGGNKSGGFGIGADINYIVLNADNIWLVNTDDETSDVGELERHYLGISVYGRVNFMGHSTKNAPTLYVIFGGFIDILLKGELDGFDVKDQFNGFGAGPTFGVGFEMYRIGVELRFDWTLTELNETGGGTFLNGLEGSKDFKTMILFRFRAH